MASRRKRKRERQRAEATAGPRSPRGWGQGSEASLSDLVLIRKAIREGWQVPAVTKAAVVGDVNACLRHWDRRGRRGGASRERSSRHLLSAASTIIAMGADNQRRQEAAQRSD